MSFLNSVLQTIGNPGERPVSLPPGNRTKRKAEDDSESLGNKTPKTNVLTRPSLSHAQTATGSQRSKSLKPLGTSYEGTGQVSSSSAPATPTSETPKQLKKGSFREIMARAKAAKAQESKPVVGTISHRPRPQELSRKQHERMQKRRGIFETEGQSQGKSSDKGARNSRREVGASGKQKKKKQTLPSYSGTAKPKPLREQPTYKGTAGAKPVTKAAVKSKHRQNEYAGTDEDIDSYGEEEEEDDDDNGYGYSDEESDDMEAGYMDVEEEESRALKFAQKEDEQELRKENALKQEKEQRKKKLEELKSRRGPQKY